LALFVVGRTVLGVKKNVNAGFSICRRSEGVKNGPFFSEKWFSGFQKKAVFLVAQRRNVQKT
jgi:hypothetical protein